MTGYIVTIANGPASREIDVAGATEVHADLVNVDVVSASIRFAHSAPTVTIFH